MNLRNLVNQLKNNAKMGLVTLLAPLILNSCKVENRTYDFDATLDREYLNREYLSFQTTWVPFHYKNTLTVYPKGPYIITLKNGFVEVEEEDKIVYEDHNDNDGKIEKVIRYSYNKMTHESVDDRESEVDQVVIQKAQGEYTAYLNAIKESKKNSGLNAIEGH